MVRHYVALLEGMLAEPERAVGLVPLLPEVERERIVIEWNTTRRDYPKDRAIHQVFEEQARRHPQAVAVVFGEQELSYGELEVRSRRLSEELGGGARRTSSRLSGAIYRDGRWAFGDTEGGRGLCAH